MASWPPPSAIAQVKLEIWTRGVRPRQTSSSQRTIRSRATVAMIATTGGQILAKISQTGPSRSPSQLRSAPSQSTTSVIALPTDPRGTTAIVSVFNYVPSVPAGLSAAGGRAGVPQIARIRPGSVRLRWYTDLVLRELRIENLLLIERAELRLGEGLNAITGETGAGKTVLAHSLDLLMGGKAKGQIVRPGAEEAWVEGVFDLPTGLLEEPEFEELAERLPEGADEVVLGRRVSAGGRTSAFVAGRAATAADLKLLGGRLLAFYGQHEHRKLTIASAQLEILDGFAGAEHLELRGSTARRTASAGSWPRSWTSCASARGRGSATWTCTATSSSEIEEVAPDPEERDGIAAERERLRHAEGLREAAAGAHAGLAGAEEDGGGATAALAQAESLLRARPGSTRSSTRSPSGSRRWRSSSATSARSCATTPRGWRPTRGRWRRSRSGWKRSTGSSASTAAASSRCWPTPSAAGRRSRGWRAPRFEAPRRRRRWLRPRRGGPSWASELSAGREKAARPLEKRVAAELEQLSMAGATLEVVLEPHPDGYGANGRETVELRVAPNPGIEAAPLRDAASGGELSRVMLALSGLGAAAEGRDPGLRRDRRRDRRQHRPGRRRAAAGAGGGATGPLHHPPAAGRLAGRGPLPDREGGRRRARRSRA